MPALFAAVALLGCGRKPEEATPAQAAPPVAFGEHRMKPFSGTASKQFGADCSEYGPAECLSGICIHTLPDPKRGYVCSEECGGAQPCAEGWRCARLHPQATRLFCVPNSRGDK